MAEARSAVAQPRVVDIEEREETLKYALKAWKRALVRRFFSAWNSLRNGMWPTPVWNLGVTTSFFSVLLVGDWKWARPINTRLYYLGDLMHIHAGVPRLLRVPLISVFGGFTFFLGLMYVRRWTLRLLLSYRGWMYEPPRTQSWSTVLWGAVVRLVSGYSPSTYSYQKSLPFQPVPKLKDTMDGFLSSLEPLYGKESEMYQKYKRDAELFQKGLGPKLQRVLFLKSLWSQNWVTDWWEKYVYLMSRTPTPINSNYYVLDHANWQPTNRQISRAARTAYQALKIQYDLTRERVKPLVIRNTIPLCMQQYERIFATCRVPGEEFDELQTFKRSKHIIVQRRGLLYKLSVVDRTDYMLTPQSLEKQLEWIIEDADESVGSTSESSRSVAALTGIDRTEWANLRKRHLLDGNNKDTLHIVESAIFHVILDTRSFDTWSERGKHLMHGDGATFWFDKSFSILVFSDGKMGLNTEHSWGDAPVMAHISEFNLTAEVIEGLYDDDGYCLVPQGLRYTQGPLLEPQRLMWDIQPELESSIEKALTFARTNNADLDLFVECFQSYGKGFIKTCKVSPDAYIQLALQLAYFKESGGQFALTYESSMTRLYLAGRTETVRSLTTETTEFVRAMNDGGSSKKHCIELLQRACQRHQRMYRDAMNGKGVDRHMFGLFVACKGLGYVKKSYSVWKFLVLYGKGGPLNYRELHAMESEFLLEALTMPWILSTSQQPQQQIANSPDCNHPQFRDKVSPGGGFGPVSDKGYGVSYMIPGDNQFYFHVSSKKSVGNTDSRRFMGHLFESFREMKALFEESETQKEACANGVSTESKKSQ